MTSYYKKFRHDTHKHEDTKKKLRNNKFRTKKKNLFARNTNRGVIKYIINNNKYTLWAILKCQGGIAMRREIYSTWNCLFFYFALYRRLIFIESCTPRWWVYFIHHDLFRIFFDVYMLCLRWVILLKALENLRALISHTFFSFIL